MDTRDVHSFAASLKRADSRRGKAVHASGSSRGQTRLGGPRRNIKPISPSPRFEGHRCRVLARRTVPCGAARLHAGSERRYLGM